MEATEVSVYHLIYPLMCISVEMECGHLHTGGCFPYHQLMKQFLVLFQF